MTLFFYFLYVNVWLKIKDVILHIFVLVKGKIMLLTKTISETIDNDYKNFALYTISNRAIPSYVDGFKPYYHG